VRCAVYLAAILVTLPTTAAAQKDAFRDALVAFHSRLAGDYGDEGPVIVKSLDQMASSLATWDEAIRAAEQESRSRLATAPNAERFRIHTTLAELYGERGRSADAVREMDAAIRIDGSRADVHARRGLLLEAMGRQQDAVAAFRRAWEIDRDDPVSAYLFASRRAADERDEVTPQTASLSKALERRLRSVPSDRHIPLFAELGLLPDAAAVTPVFSPARYADGFTLVSQGRYQEALATFRRNVTADPLVASGTALSERLRQGIAQLREGDTENAVTNIEAAVALSPRSSEAHRILGAAYADLGNDGKSIEHFETAVRLSPDDERANVALGRALMRAGRADAAERVLVNTLARLPQSADAHSALADLYESSRGEDAVHQLELAGSFTVLAGKAALYFRLADLQHRFLHYDRVIDPLSRRVRLDPNDARSHTDLGLAYTRVGRTNDALVELVVAALIGPDDAEALAAIGQIQFDAGEYAAAEAVLSRAAVVAPTFPQARYLLGQTLARLGRSDESREQLADFDRLRSAANEETRRTFEIDMLRKEAERESAAGRNERAIAAWRQVVDREPKRRDDRISLADALLRANRASEALEHLETAAKLDGDPDVYRRLADVYATLGRAAESTGARQTYQRLLRERRHASER
jgi:tetratricopeptide (TPR) repeat protein